MVIMDRERALAALQELKKCADQEFAHVEADAILCLLLKELGYGDVVQAFRALDKWYA